MNNIQKKKRKNSRVIFHCQKAVMQTQLNVSIFKLQLILRALSGMIQWLQHNRKTECFVNNTKRLSR